MGGCVCCLLLRPWSLLVSWSPRILVSATLILVFWQSRFMSINLSSLLIRDWEVVLCSSIIWLFCWISVFNSSITLSNWSESFTCRVVGFFFFLGWVSVRGEWSIFFSPLAEYLDVPSSVFMGTLGGSFGLCDGDMGRACIYLVALWSEALSESLTVVFDIVHVRRWVYGLCVQKRRTAFRNIRHMIITHYRNLRKWIVITLLRQTAQKILILLEQMLKLYTYVSEYETIWKHAIFTG